jgi:hypothetical protein
MLSSIPNTCATNSTTAPSNRAVPFMLIVAPSGRTKPATLGRTPSVSFATRRLVGSVALDEEVENAVAMIGTHFRRNGPGAVRTSRRNTIG